MPSGTAKGHLPAHCPNLESQAFHPVQSLHNLYPQPCTRLELINGRDSQSSRIDLRSFRILLCPTLEQVLCGVAQHRGISHRILLGILLCPTLEQVLHRGVARHRGISHLVLHRTLHTHLGQSWLKRGPLALVSLRCWGSTLMSSCLPSRGETTLDVAPLEIAATTIAHTPYK